VGRGFRHHRRQRGRRPNRCSAFVEASLSLERERVGRVCERLQPEFAAIGAKNGCP